MREDLWGFVDGSEAAPADTDEARARYVSRQRKTLGTISLSIEENLLYLLGIPEDPKVLWEKLATLFQKKTWSNRMGLKRKLSALRLTSGGDLENHLKQMTEVMDELIAVDSPVSAEDRVVNLLMSLPPEYEVLVSILGSRENLPNYETVVDALLNEERKMKELAGDKSTKGEEEALAARNLRGPRCYQCGKIGHIKRNCREAGSGGRNPPRERGESARRGQSLPRERWESPEHRQRGAYYSKEPDSDNEGVGCLATHAYLTSESKAQRWIVDSGATSHMSCDRKLFKTLRETSDKLVVTIGDGRSLKATGIGNVGLWMNSGRGGRQVELTLHDVLLVPELARNLFSVSQAAKMGKTLDFTEQECLVKEVRSNRVVARGHRQGGLYYLCLHSAQPSAHLASAELWHRRFGHLGRQSLTQLERHGMVRGLKVTPSSPNDQCACEPCLEGKQHRSPFPNQPSRAKGLLNLVHTDVCGKLDNRSLGGKEYFVTFVDSHSNMTWVYFLRHKSEVYGVFRKWKAAVENETGRRLKILRSDNGGEYTSTEFREYLERCGIRHETTVPKTPAQNGKAERMNRTIMESVRAMLRDGDMAKEFWAEAVRTAVYIRNRCPSSSLPEITPMEVWTGRKPDVSHLRVFGCPAYAHVPRDERGKLSPKTKKCWMLGYGDTTKAYRLYDKDRQRILYSRDVSFNERDTRRQEEWSSQDEGDDAEVLPGVEYMPAVDNATIRSPTPEQLPIHDNPLGAPRRMSERIRLRPGAASAPKKSQRTTRKPDRFGEWATLAATMDPETPKEAMATPRARQWSEAMEREMASLRQNEVWTLTDLPEGKKTVGSRWVFRTKTGLDGTVARYKARLVARGFSQKPGTDYEETFSPVVRGESIRMLFSLAAQEGMELHQLDVETAFLHGTLQEEVYMDQPEGYEQRGKEHQVCRLHKSIYGLKQSPRCWNQALDDYLKKMGFVQTSSDPCVYISVVKNNFSFTKQSCMLITS